MNKACISVAAALCFLVAACGGNEPPASIGATPLAAPQVLSSSTSGTFYDRSDSVAYAPDFSPSSGIAAASVTLANGSTFTDGSGFFNITSSTVPTNAQTPLSATAFGYQPTTFPWAPADAAAPLALGTYAGVAGTARPGFVGGAVLHDQGGWLQNTYNDGMFTPTIDRISKSMGGNIVAFSDTAWVTAWNPQVPSVTIANTDLTGTIPMAPLAMYQTMVQDAKSRNMQFMMMLGIFGDGRVGPEIWRWSQVPASNTAYWDKVFSDYQSVVLERTAIARDLGIEYVSLGIDLAPQWNLGPSRWKPLVAAMRAIGYTGKIMMFLPMEMMWNSNPYATQNFGDGSHDRKAMMGVFDAIGIIFNSGALRTNFSETLSKAQTRTRLRSSVSKVLSDLSDAPVPVHVMITTPSVFGGVSDPAYIEPCVLPDCGSLALTSVRDYQQQADMYQAVAEAINATPVGNGRVMGLISWGYHYRDDPTWGLNPGDSAYDKAASIRGKPVEAVVKYWLGRWKPSDRERVFNWAAATFPQFFPGSFTAGYLAPYSYRYYPQTGNYLAEGDGRMVVHNGHNWILQDVGGVADLLPMVTQAGF